CPSCAPRAGSFAISLELEGFDEIGRMSVGWRTVGTDRKLAPQHGERRRRTSDSKVLGVVGPRYAPLQNKDAFAWFQPFLDAKEAALHTAGSLRGGSR